MRLRGESIDEVVNAAAIVAIEVYASGPTPVQYGACSIVMWTGHHDAMGAERQQP